MKIIDRYVLRQFVVTMIFAVLAFVIIFVAINMMENLDDFLDKHASIGIILTYYFHFVPEIIKLVLPVAMLLSALFTTGRMTGSNELTALKSGGMSLYRYMLPIILFALFVSAAGIYFNGWIVPSENQKKLQIARVYFQKDIELVAKNNIFIQNSPTRILSIGLYDEHRSSAQQVSIQDFDPSDPTIITGRYDAQEMVWDPARSTWTLRNGVERRFRGGTETARRFEALQMGNLNFRPEDIIKKQEKPEEMNYPDLSDFIRTQKLAGHDVARWEVDLHTKVSFPFASLIVVLFGIPFSSIKRRSGPGVEFGAAAAVTFLYLVCLQVSQAFGYNGDMDPVLTAWLANLVFFVAAVFFLWRVQK